MLSIKEIDEIGRLMIPMGPITGNSNNNICSRFAKLCCQAMAYVSLVEKIKGLKEMQYMSNDEAGSDVHNQMTSCHNNLLYIVESFIDES